MNSERAIDSAWLTLRIALGLAAFLAGLDKYFNLLTDWTRYLSPIVSGIVPATQFMHVVGIIEIAAGALLLGGWTRWGGYIVSAWLVGIAINLMTTGAFFDVAVRDLEMAVMAYTLARLSEAREARTALIRQPQMTQMELAADARR